MPFPTITSVRKDGATVPPWQDLTVKYLANLFEEHNCLPSKGMALKWENHEIVEACLIGVLELELCDVQVTGSSSQTRADHLAQVYPPYLIDGLAYGFDAGEKPLTFDSYGTSPRPTEYTWGFELGSATWHELQRRHNERPHAVKSAQQIMTTDAIRQVVS